MVPTDALLLFPIPDPALVEQAVRNGIERYIQSRRAKVPEFVARYFSGRGALRLHRKALGKDLYRAPLNLLWAGPWLVLQAFSGLCRRLGAESVARRLDRLPKGFETDVQREVEWLIYTELLELPYSLGERTSHKDALLAEILAEPTLARICEDYLDTIRRKLDEPGFRKALEHNLAQLAIARMAATDLAASIISLAAGYAAFQKATPGAVAGGTALAGAIAHHLAVSSFWLGPTLGAWYYSIFPATASAGLIVASIGAVMATLGVVSALAGIITDPILAVTGIHRRRLEKFIDSLGNELRGSGESRLKIHDHYLARVFDLLDLLKAAAQAAM